MKIRRSQKQMDEKTETINLLREQLVQMEVDFNKERGERLVSEIILSCVLFAAGVIVGVYLR